ncbi:MAG TPA: hypothetical protein VNS58_00430 [Puia sp.]|nr:hypothetical protein [Puia sp.]
MPLYLIVFSFYYIALLLSCFLIGCLLVRKSWPLEYKLLVVLTGLTSLVETIVFLNVARRIDSRWMYSFFAPVECGFILYILYSASVHPAIKRLNAILLGFLPISIGIAYYMHPVFTRFNESAGLFYDFLELIAACSFLTDVLLNKSDTPLGRQPLFWMAAGILFYSSLFTLLDALRTYIPKIPVQYLTMYSVIANTFMYTGFIACFICLRRTDR